MAVMLDLMPHLKLTSEGALKALRAGIKKAEDMGVPQCISIVDDGGNLLAFVRMDGARINSIESSRNKAITAASSRLPSGTANPIYEVKLAITTQGRNINLKGGIPIIVGGICVGGVGVGSGTGDQDRDVALAAVAAIEGAKVDFDFTQLN
jgi:glc operon protein GlcG